MSQPGRRPGTVVGDEQHVLQALWSMKDILTLRGGPWVCAVSALVLVNLILPVGLVLPSYPFKEHRALYGLELIVRSK